MYIQYCVYANWPFLLNQQQPSIPLLPWVLTYRHRHPSHPLPHLLYWYGSHNLEYHKFYPGLIMLLDQVNSSLCEDVGGVFLGLALDRNFIVPQVIAAPLKVRVRRRSVWSRCAVWTVTSEMGVIVLATCQVTWWQRHRKRLNHCFPETLWTIKAGTFSLVGNG